jgi:hypothetical protein
LSDILNKKLTFKNGIYRYIIEDCISEGKKISFDFFKNKMPADYSFWNNLGICYRDKFSDDRKSVCRKKRECLK